MDIKTELEDEPYWEQHEPHDNEGWEEMSMEYRENAVTDALITCDDIKTDDSLETEDYESTAIAASNTFSSNIPLECDWCDRTFEDDIQLTKHEKLHMFLDHIGGDVYCCKECGLDFLKEAALKQHVRLHTKVKPYKCGICGECFVRELEKIKHQKSHGDAGDAPQQQQQQQQQPSQQEWYSSSHSPNAFEGQDFFEAETISSPAKRHHTDLVDEQALSFEEDAIYDLPDSNVEENANDYGDEYQHNFVEPQMRKPKRARATAKKSTSQVSAQKSSRNSNDSSAPNQSSSDSEASHPCPQCPKVFNHIVLLRQHLATHQTLPRYTCKFCPCSFISRQNMLLHEQSHSQGNPRPKAKPKTKGK